MVVSPLWNISEDDNLNVSTTENFRVVNDKSAEESSAELAFPAFWVGRVENFSLEQD